MNKKPVIIIALITAVCVLGDAMMFIVLPLYWKEFGLTSLWQVGILLSINRFIRLPINPLVGWCYLRLNKRTGVLLAVILAMLTTFSYGWLESFWLLFFMRALWGVAWAFLRLGGYLTVIDTSTDRTRGNLVGLYNGLWGLGGLVGMAAGGILADLVSIQTVTNTFGFMALITIPLVLKYVPAVPAESEDTSMKKDKQSIEVTNGKQIFKKPQVLTILCSGLLIPLIIFGIFASTLSAMIDFRLSESFLFLGMTIGAASFAGIIQAIRWGWDPFIAPYIGKISDLRWGRKPLLILALFGGAAFFALIPFGASVYCLLFLLIGFQVMSTMMVTLNDSIASDVASKTSKVKVITAYTVAVDLGSATGPLLSFLIIGWVGIDVLYWLTSGLLCLIGLFWLNQFKNESNLISP
ncbi:MFS transporter [Bacillus sp. Marseille-Q3570]|uniref:MFS transporter n=1 Tax=Bacillus sp. Marseille-Q3570 TaxID=2963522 RepID=UPI0021B6FEF4|nr:MFS transporter [Bacillus sp. Marseille-Q3570]